MPPSHQNRICGSLVGFTNALHGWMNDEMVHSSDADGFIPHETYNYEVVDATTT